MGGLTATEVKLLKTLKGSSGERRRKMLKRPEVKRLLRAVAYNVLKGAVPLDDRQFAKLRRFKKSVRLLSCSDLSDRRRLALAQKGGFLSALLSPLLGSVLGGLATRIFR